MPSSRADDARTDESLLEAHLGGDPGALESLIRRYRNELHGFLTRFLGSSAAADDVFQETFLQVHLAGATFDATRSFKPWLFTIAANKARDFHRKRKRRAMASLEAPLGGSSESGSLVDLLPSDQPAPSASSERADQQVEVKRALDALPHHQREIILLGYFQRLSYQQIAEMLDIPLGTVKSRMHAAVALFSQRWGDAHSEEGAPSASQRQSNKGATRNP
ncbi:MAG: RNA polymerase sigma factor [Phycisphaerales bacterium]|nr:RNA polymerase sigma factor [Phycisphaerales bacterium]